MTNFASDKSYFRMQQKLSLFQSLNSSPSRAVGMEEIVRLIRYDSDVANKTENYRRMASVLGKEKADEEILAANFSPERERGKARKEYAAGTHEVSVDDAWPKVELALQRMGFKLVRKRQGNFYSVYQIPADQLQATIAMGDDDSQNATDIQFAEGNFPF